MKKRTDQRLGKRYKNDRNVRAKHASMDELYETFYSAKVAEGVSKRTLETYEENYRFLCDYLAMTDTPREINSVTTEILRKYITWMLNDKRKWEGHAHKSEANMTKGLSAVTVNTRLKGLRTMFNFLYAEELIQANPFRFIKPVREPEEEIQILTADQLERLLKAPDKRTYAGFRDYVFMTLLVDGFFRINEALQLKRSDINFDIGMAKASAKNVKSRRARSVPLSKPTLRLVKELLKENEDFGTDYLFVTNYGLPISDDRMRDRIKEHAKNAGIETRVYPHLFRHTAATMYLENGGDLRYLADLLGHSDLRMVQRYTHLSISALKEQHRRFSPINNVLSNMTKSRKTKRST
ncbi:tyrosine-type recombinase/integrase [Paenibacillus elgii]|uniref:tyrosine-type recombinase/integrase n=1 Tax=Paenibacillus elgii TaxID=189691 RepID=UPI00203BB2C1|nr:tyrosine-type recombinase/integrase [Paenibacillus elgii]MCM3272976.1 tyrosine-type recombinase/integrase [Paenibacillus elgii]